MSKIKAKIEKATPAILAIMAALFIATGALSNHFITKNFDNEKATRAAGMDLLLQAVEAENDSNERTSWETVQQRAAHKSNANVNVSLHESGECFAVKAVHTSGYVFEKDGVC